MRHWTQAEEEYLIERVELRCSAAEIGRALKRTRNSVIGKAHKLGYAWDLSDYEISRYARIAGRIRAIQRRRQYASAR